MGTSDLRGALLAPYEAYCEEHGDVADLDLGATQVLVLGDEAYPTQVAAIPSPPPVLFVRGNVAALRTGVAVVGTRNISAIGRAVVPVAVGAVAEAGAPVVSGLARGVDRLAHESSLELGVPTVAVIATHVEHVYPAEHAGLANDIVQAGGAIVSTSLGNEVSAGRLHGRNRVIVALSSTVIPAEAGLRSGTMSAAGYAFNLQRTVVVPVPRARFREHPGAFGLLALAGLGGDATDGMALSADARRALAGREYPADVIAYDREDLRAWILLSHGFSRWHQPTV
jgi:DNA protecting protein DprA